MRKFISFTPNTVHLVWDDEEATVHVEDVRSGTSSGSYPVRPCP